MKEQKLTELIKHHKTKPFNRKNMMDLAKILRNCSISSSNREIVVRALANYFEREDPFFDRKMFNQIAAGIVESDFRTVGHSTVQEKKDEPDSNV